MDKSKRSKKSKSDKTQVSNKTPNTLSAAREFQDTIGKRVRSTGRSAARRPKYPVPLFSMCVTPDDIAETKAELKKKGLNVDFTEHGVPIAKSHKHYEKIVELFAGGRYCDKNASSSRSAPKAQHEQVYRERLEARRQAMMESRKAAMDSFIRILAGRLQQI